MTNCEQINDLGITVISTFTPSAYVLTAANKARRMLYYMPDEGDILSLYNTLVRPRLECTIKANCPYLRKDIYHLEIKQLAATRWVIGLRYLNYEESLSPSKKTIRNDLVLTHNQIGFEASQLLKFSRRSGIRRSLLRLGEQTGRTRRRGDSFACRVVKYWSRLPLAVASVPDELVFKRQLSIYIYP